MAIKVSLSVESLYQRFRAMLHLILLQAMLPLSLSYVAAQRFHQRSKRSSTDNKEDVDDDSIPTTEEAKEFVVVLTGGKMSKSLHFARCLRSYADSAAAKGISLKIVVLESERFRWCASRFSRCVDAFEVLTSPRDSPQKYMDGIYDACKKHNATHFIPVAAPAEAVYDSMLKERLQNDLKVQVHHVDAELCRILDDKHRFGTFLSDTLKCRTLHTYQVSTDDEAREYNKMLQEKKDAGDLKRDMVLKNLTYDPIHRLDLFCLPTTPEKLDAYLTKIRQDGNPISKEEPWQLQEFLTNGTEYAAMIVVRDNRLLTLTCCPSSASQLNYVHVEIPSVRDWLQSFLKRLRKSEYVLTGQLCFDFMVVQEDFKDVAYPIECNPRVHTQCSVYNRDDVRAMFGSLLVDDREENQNKLNRLLERDYGESASKILVKAPSSTSLSSVSSSEEDQAAMLGEAAFVQPGAGLGAKSSSSLSSSSSSSSSSSLNVYWFYNEFFKILPNSWLLKYNDDAQDLAVRKKLSELPSPALPSGWTWYLPGALLAVLLSAPVWLALGLEYLLSADSDQKLSATQHAKASYHKFVEFVHRLTLLEENVEGDFWHADPVPFLAKNHVQVPSRLLATIRTGAEWKKLDFAIGKVVEVGGD